MKNCKYCREQIPSNAKVCPNCKRSLGLNTGVKVLIVVGIIIVLLGGCVFSCTNSLNKAVKEAFGGYDDQTGKKSFAVGEVFESKHMKVKLDKTNLNFTNYSQYATVDSDKKIVQFSFTAENIGDEDQTFYYYDFNCYADDTAYQQFYSVDDAGLSSGGSISKGKKISINVYCEVPKNASKVYVEYKPLLAENNYQFNA